MQIVELLKSATTAEPFFLLVVLPLAIMLTGAAWGIAEALRRGLRAYVLRLMGLEDETQAGGKSNATDV